MQEQMKLLSAELEQALADNQEVQSELKEAHADLQVRQLCSVCAVRWLCVYNHPAVVSSETSEFSTRKCG
jgi:hypothetical protein